MRNDYLWSGSVGAYDFFDCVCRVSALVSRCGYVWSNVCSADAHFWGGPVPWDFWLYHPPCCGDVLSARPGFVCPLAGMGCVAVDSAKDSHAGLWALSKKGYFVQLHPLPLSGMPERSGWHVCRRLGGVAVLRCRSRRPAVVSWLPCQSVLYAGWVYAR